MNCDDEAWVYLSRDGPSGNFSEIGYVRNWGKTLEIDIADCDEETVVRVECRDHGGFGGFIASMEFPVGKSKYSTTNTLSQGNWRLIDSSDGFMLGLVYRAKTGWPWYLSNDSALAHDANWVWNGKTGNTMTFEFNFGECEGIKMRERERERVHELT